MRVNPDHLGLAAALTLLWVSGPLLLDDTLLSWHGRVGTLESQKATHDVPKRSDNFLRGFCRQLREALDEGTELAYEFAELADEAAELIDGAIDGDAGDQMVSSDTAAGQGFGGQPALHVDGQVQSRQPVLPGVVRGDVTLPDGDNRPAGVPRGTRSRVPAPVSVRLPQAIVESDDGT